MSSDEAICVAAKLAVNAGDLTRARALASAGNVLVPAILLLEERGYVVSVVRTAECERCTAKRGDTELLADNPIELLGLASLVDARGPSWPATDEQVRSTCARLGIDL